MDAQDALVPRVVRRAALEPGICALAARPRVFTGCEGFLDGRKGPLLPLEVLVERPPINERRLDEDDRGVGREVVGEQFRRVHAGGRI